MQIIVDECIAESTKRLLENLGFKVLTIESILHRKAEDEEIYEFASDKQIPILTHDKRFGLIHLESSDEPATTIVLPMASPHPEATNELLERSLADINLDSKRYSQKLILISHSKIRIRSKTLGK